MANKIYKIRIYQGSVSTRHGTDTVEIFDNSNRPKYITKEAIAALMKKGNYRDAKEGEEIDVGYTGYWDESEQANFEYIGYIDVKIPETIVQQIIDDAKTA